MIKIIDGLLDVPTVNDYLCTLKKMEITELQQELLKIQYSAPYHQIKVEDLAITVSKPIETVNAVYGKLGHKIKDLLGVDIIGDEGYWKVLSIGYEQDNRFYWQMRNQVSQAFTELNFF
ncbi:hypothetical protein A5482_015495 (plasmid) [Cyanobacterium sp. IPPAS B-1200]|uniref:hypothetical protein n=1 Tax=Cyanobacterium sp. IPPAS B-1200 TaxID=1562720 RepID=UPI00085267FA|nr:hypothetical protein A5482_15340 [Cyanobacterium sp. IPPAS B-1200]